MKNILIKIGERARDGVVFGIFLTLTIAGITHALNYNWSDTTIIQDRKVGNPLTASGWNLLVGNVDNLNERLAALEANPGKSFGPRVSKSVGTNYTAEADGFLWLAGNSVYFRVTIDGNNYTYIEANGVSGANGTAETVPIRKGEVYSVTNLGGTYNPYIYWTPLQ